MFHRRPSARNRQRKNRSAVNTNPVSNPMWSPEIASRWARLLALKACSSSGATPLLSPAMIAAAKADGHVDQQEMQRIEAAVKDAGADTHLQALLHSELNKPLDPADVARLAQTPQQASEIYLASLIVVDEQNFMEKAYLQELAKQLQLSSDVTYQLEQQLKS